MEREGLLAVIDTLDLGYPPELREKAQTPELYARTVNEFLDAIGA